MSADVNRPSVKSLPPMPVQIPDYSEGGEIGSSEVTESCSNWVWIAPIFLFCVQFPYILFVGIVLSDSHSMQPIRVPTDTCWYLGLSAVTCAAILTGTRGFWIAKRMRRTVLMVICGVIACASFLVFCAIGWDYYWQVWRSDTGIWPLW